MPIDKRISAKLNKFADVFGKARECEANESDTVMYLIKFFEEVLGYDPLVGEITKEVPIKERHCDFSVVLDKKTHFLVEAKSAGIKNLSARHIEQAENYASRAPINWVLLTNGVEWQFYHVAFDPAAGISHDLVFDLNFLEKWKADPDLVWDMLSVLAKSNVQENGLEAFYEQKKLLSPKAVVKVLLGQEVLKKVRQELNRKARVRLDFEDVSRAVWTVLSKEAVAEAGDITPPTRKRHRRRRQTDKSEQLEPQASPIPSQPQVQNAADEEIPR